MPVGYRSMWKAGPLRTRKEHSARKLVCDSILSCASLFKQLILPATPSKRGRIVKQICHDDGESELEGFSWGEQKGAGTPVLFAFIATRQRTVLYIGGSWVCLKAEFLP